MRAGAWYLIRIASPWKLLVLAGARLALLVHGRAGGPEAEYVDARVCATCHRQIADDYRQTGMGRSFFRPAPANTIEDYTRRNDFYHALSDTHYSMIRRDGEFYQRRWQIGFARKGDQRRRDEGRLRPGLGQPCAILSASHGRRNPDRTPAGLVSGPKPADPGRCRRVPIPIIRGPAASSLTSACSAITEFRESPQGNEAPGSDPVFLGDLPEGIDCQRCHGPGGNHVRTAGTRRRQGGRHSRQHRESRPPEFQTPRWRSACSAIWRPPADAFPP